MLEAEKTTLVFFIYGLAFFSMGISALQQNTYGHSNFTLLKSIKYLGYFGLVHGMAEWVWMIIMLKAYPDFYTEFFALAIYLNTLSFSFLWRFGTELIEYNGIFNKITKRLPYIVSVFWAIEFFYFYFVQKTFLFKWFFVDDIMNRYFLGLPGSLITCYALYKNARALNLLNYKKIASRLKGISYLFLLYGILSGLIVDEREFFPANILNRQMFMNIFNFPVEVGRTATAISITILFILVIDIFRLETKQKLARLSRSNAAGLERRKLGRELHDIIIQNLFASGLAVENLIENTEDAHNKESLLNVKSNLNDTIGLIRSFIQNSLAQSMDLEDLNVKLQELVQQVQRGRILRIKYRYNVSEIYTSCLSNEKITELYYILKEALTNAVKHSDGDTIEVIVVSTIDSIRGTVKDNGSGFDYSKEIYKESHYGLLSMNERAAIVSGILNIDSSSNGTEVKIIIPWGVCEYEK